MAQLKSITTGRGNSGEKTDPEERRLQRWYCEAASSSMAAMHFTKTGNCSGQTNRVMTSTEGRLKTKRKICVLQTAVKRRQAVCGTARVRKTAY
jgi:hypothetical protein